MKKPATRAGESSIVEEFYRQGELAANPHPDEHVHQQINRLAKLLHQAQGYQQSDPNALIDYSCHPNPRVRAAYDLARLSYEFWQANPIV